MKQVKGTELLSIPKGKISVYGNMELGHSVHCFVLLSSIEDGVVSAKLLFRDRQQRDVVVRLTPSFPVDVLYQLGIEEKTLEQSSNALAGISELEITEHSRRVYCNLTFGDDVSVSGSCDRDYFRFLIFHRKKAAAA